MTPRPRRWLRHASMFAALVLSLGFAAHRDPGPLHAHAELITVHDRHHTESLAARGDAPPQATVPDQAVPEQAPSGSRDREKVRSRHLTILQTTDLHDHANGADHVGFDVDPKTGRGLLGSYARIAAYVNHVRATARHPVVLVDSGDWTMGTFYDFTFGDRPLALYFLEFMRYDCVTLGNHEFDYSPSGLAQILRAAQQSFDFRRPIVASNLILGGDTDLAPLVGRGKAIETARLEDLPNGLRVGYIGLMGQAAALDAPASPPVTFWSPTSAYARVQGLVDRLRMRGAQIVIVLSHSGTDATGTAGEDVELARHVTGINVIASGHTHTPLDSARTVINGGWSTYIIDAGVAGTNVARIDLTYHPSTRTTTLDASGNPAMTDDSLSSAGLSPDPGIESIVGLTDHQLNLQLGPFLAAAFADYDPANLATGIYHPVGSAEQEMLSNGSSSVPAPNGLGDLTADATRSVPNSLIAQTLAAVGGNPANLPSYDFTPFQMSAVATGLLRSKLQAAVSLSLADVYNVLPLGISPDASQALPIGYPLISAYLAPEDVKKVCALQLVVQSHLAVSEFYLNLSGVSYTLNATGSYVYFKYATAAGVLQVTGQKATAGSTPALQALNALSTLATDGGAALLAAYADNNPYARAMVDLNDSNPDINQIVANLGALGQVAAAAEADRTGGTHLLTALVVSKAVAAIDVLAGFAPADGANVGTTTVLSDTTRVRLAVDLFAVLLLGGIQAQFGVAITPYKAATGPDVLSGADLTGVLENRINADPSAAGVHELKAWMALLAYIRSGLGGTITTMYFSTPNFAQFGSFGAAVRTRNASYPVGDIGRLLSTLGGLQVAP